MSGVMIYRKARQNVRDALVGRGHHLVYRADETNRCPGCSRAQWHIGRLTAECVFCGTAIVLAESKWGGDGFPAANRPAAPAELPDPSDLEWADRRRHERMRVADRTLQLLLEGSPHSFAIKNLSAGGAMGEAPTALSAMSTVHVRFEGGILVPATVRWTQDKLIGLAFDAPVLLDASRTS